MQQIQNSISGIARPGSLQVLLKPAEPLDFFNTRADLDLPQLLAPATKCDTRQRRATEAALAHILNTIHNYILIYKIRISHETGHETTDLKLQSDSIVYSPELCDPSWFFLRSEFQVFRVYTAYVIYYALYITSNVCPCYVVQYYLYYYHLEQPETEQLINSESWTIQFFNEKGGYYYSATRMGNLFPAGKHGKLPNLQINLDSAQPTDGEDRAISDEFNSVVKGPSVAICQKFSDYQDAHQLIAEAISKGGDAAIDAAWNVVHPNVLVQMEVYDFSKKIREQFAKLIRAVVQKLPANPTLDIFESMPVVIKCFAECFDLMLKLDEIKLKKERFSNDLAFWRRHAPSHNPEHDLDDLIAKSNESTVFWASPMPVLMSTINHINSEFPQTSEMFQKVLNLLGAVSDVCAAILTHNRGSSTDDLCLRCIVGAVLIYDYMCPTGAFRAKTKFHVREAMELLVQTEPRQTTLINAIKFSSKHLTEDTSDPKIKMIFV